jgi:4-hydroxy-2-oxovalerate aldolase
MSLFKHLTEIMEVTLRDGSYVIDFQFTPEDTATLVSALAGVGFQWIEIGHGLGLNARDKGVRLAFADDEAHLEAAASVAGDTKWGAFFIPGIGNEASLRLAAKYKMPFVRIGTNVDAIERARPFIELAKSLGMIACYNAMKTYAVTPQEFAKVAKQTQEWGADIVYMVDSAGMTPEDVTDFIQAIRQETDVPLGFHGHDNLSMGMANCLRAIELGVSIVDTSLRGMGRSAGNVNTEALLANLQRKGDAHALSIDLNKTMDISAGIIAPLVPGQGIDPMGVTAGFAGFHSSFENKVRSYADRYNVDIRELIVKLCEQDRIDAPDQLLEVLAEQMAQDKQTRVLTIPAFGIKSVAEQKNKPTLNDLLARLYSQATKTRTYTVLNVVMSAFEEPTIGFSGNIHGTKSYTIGSATVSTIVQLEELCKIADGNVDILLLDIDNRAFLGAKSSRAIAQSILKNTLLLTYSDSNVWVEAIRDQVVRLLNEETQGAHISIFGADSRSDMLALQLVNYGATISLYDTDGQPYLLQLMSAFRDEDEGILIEANSHNHLGNAQVAIVWNKSYEPISLNIVKYLNKGSYLIDAGLGNLTEDELTLAHERGVLPIRVNMWQTLTGALQSAHESAQVRHEALGWSEVNGVKIVAGGAIGAANAVIVDSVKKPTRIIGVANGKGGIVMDYTPEQANNVRKVLSFINDEKVKPNV